MALFTYKEFYLLLLTSSCVTFVKSFSEIDKEGKFEEINEVFSEIEKNHDKLKKVFKAILTEQLENKEKENDLTTKTVNVGIHQRTSATEDCRCLPYHLCYPETGEQVSDGRFLLESRVNSYVCADPNDVCCTQYSPSSQRMEPDSSFSPSSQRMKPVSSSNCGYGYLSDAAQAFAVDDPTVSKFGQFPWTVMINRAKRYTCVGSLIHPKVVLTAAHCVNTTDDFSARAGEWNANAKNEPFGHQDRNVIDVIRHPQFRLDNLFYDVALLILEEEFELQENINTVCLTKPAPEPLITYPDRCVTSGWGIDKPFGRYNRIMKKLDFSLTDYEQCQQAFRTSRLGNKFQLHQSFVCAKGQDGSDACQGNGGAPLVCSIGKEPDRYQQVGLVSWGIGCAEGTPSVFTKISQIKDWIDNVFDTMKYSKDYYTE